MQTRKPLGGGIFQYAPNIRGAAGENFDGVQRILDGDHSELKTLEISPGDLQIFFGRKLAAPGQSGGRPARTAHGDLRLFPRTRLHRPPGTRRRAIFGRMAPIHEEMLKRDIVRTDALAD